jgi:hypothetical protein
VIRGQHPLDVHVAEGEAIVGGDVVRQARLRLQ